MKGKRNVVERKAERGGVEDGKGERNVYGQENCVLILALVSLIFIILALMRQYRVQSLEGK